jgi:uncharacterized protein DUF5681
LASCAITSTPARASGCCFQKGRSGNPRGRSSEKRNLYHSLQEMLEAKVLGKNERTMPGDEIIATRIIEGAMKGSNPRGL